MLSVLAAGIAAAKHSFILSFPEKIQNNAKKIPRELSQYSRYIICIATSGILCIHSRAIPLQYVWHTS